MLTARTRLLLVLLGLLPAGPAGAWTHSPLQNLPVVTATGAQDLPQMIADGAGGAIVVWRDSRGGSGTEDIYAQHIMASGALDPAWPAAGRVVCGAANFQDSPVLVSDGGGGAIVAWVDWRSGTNSDIYAQHVFAAGNVDPAWPADGRALCTAADEQSAPAICSDGSGGAIVGWQDFRGGASYDIYAARVLSSGVTDPAWPANGRSLVALAEFQGGPAIQSDGAGGAIVAWQDNRLRVSSDNYDIYAQRILPAGVVDPAWPANGRLVCNAFSNQIGVAIVADGAGGSILAWTDFRSWPSNLAVFAQRLLASGVVDPTWPANGRVLVNPLGAGVLQNLGSLVSDGAGGAIVVFEESRTGTADVIAQHVLPSGVTDPAWPGEGRALTRATGDQQFAKVASDGAGGAITAWRDARNGTAFDIYAQRVLSTGLVDPAWPADGRAVCTAVNSQLGPVLVTDAAGGVLVAWSDNRGTSADVYAQNITTFGVLGSPWPAITSIADLPNDQGGRVRIRWNASQMDTLPSFEIGSYGVWRQVTAGAATRAIAGGARVADADGAVAAERGVYRAVAGATVTTWWEGVGTVAARGDPWYTFVAETFRDSSGAGNPLTTFRVDAHALLQAGWWDSAPVSGYSVDNLAPAAPAPFTGQYLAGTARLHWNRNAEYDLAGYRLYRGATASFVPGPGNLLAALPDTGYVDAAATRYVYKLTAVDVHGNESPVATLEFPGPTGVGDAATPRELTFAAPMPNPASVATTLRYALPRAGHVRLAVYDAAGRLVRSVASGPREAGDHAEAWDLRGADGRAMGAGLYFARLEAHGRALVRRVAVTR